MERVKKNRRGEGHPATSITDEDVRKIRQLYAEGELVQREIAEMFGVTRSTVSHIVCRRVWAHVE